MRIIIVFLTLLFLFPSNLIAGKNIIELRLAYKNNRPNTNIIFNKNLAENIYVKTEPFPTVEEISEVSFSIEENTPPPWLESAIKSINGKISSKPNIGINFYLNGNGGKTLSQITSKNIGNLAAFFIDGQFIAVTEIVDILDYGFFMSVPSKDENEIRNIVHRINQEVAIKNAR